MSIPSLLSVSWVRLHRVLFQDLKPVVSRCLGVPLSTEVASSVTHEFRLVERHIASIEVAVILVKVHFHCAIIEIGGLLAHGLVPR